MDAYYNEIDRFCCDWLSNLMDAGCIMPGDIDDRSIADVPPETPRRYTRAHFFAGLGGWDFALQLAGWPDDRPVWTGSCPCQPLSIAGSGSGADDDRHLWPDFYRLVAKSRPAVVFGEQVASPAGRDWLAAVRLDMAGLGYASGAADLPAAGVGAPHIRQRLFWVGDDPVSQRQSRQEPSIVSVDGRMGDTQGGEPRRIWKPETSDRREGETRRSSPRGIGMADSRRLGDERRSQHREAHATAGSPQGEIQGGERERRRVDARDRGFDGRVAEPDGRNAGTEGLQRSREHGLGTEDGVAGRLGDPDGQGHAFGETIPREDTPAPSGRQGQDHWLPSSWIECTDGKSRPVEPGVLPLAHGVPARLGRLRAYGNAIVPQAAAEFVMAFMECR